MSAIGAQASGGASLCPFSRATMLVRSGVRENLGVEAGVLQPRDQFALPAAR